ncbi:MAG: SH3 domain-containing protein [Clostridia bacterium]|nr:SH3 domain-containing protein [Clostridia bacterium]
MSKRVFAVLLCALLLSLALGSALAADMQLGSMYVNTANGKTLTFRSSPSTTKDNYLANIPYGTKVYVLSWDGSWARIRYNSAVGYVVKKHLSIARPEPYETVVQRREEAKAAAQAERERLQALRSANSKLDQSKLKKVDPYDATVITGVRDLKAPLYKKASLLADILVEYSEGFPVTVRSANRDWALVYNGADETTGYMLLEDLVADVVEEEILED